MNKKIVVLLQSACCFIFLAPSFLTALNILIFKSNSGLALMRYIALIIGVISNMRNGKIHFPKRLRVFGVIWGVLFLIQLIHNGDIQHQSILDTVLFLGEICFMLFFVSLSNNFGYLMLICIMIFCLLHIVFGAFFYIHPTSLITFGNNTFFLDTFGENQFLTSVNSGWFMGISNHYSVAGIYMSVSTILFAVLCMDKFKRNKEKAFLYLALFVIAFICLVLTGKRAHLLFTAISLIVTYLIGYIEGNYGKRISQVMSIILLIVIVVIALLNIPAFAPTVARFLAGGSLNDISAGRIERLWKPTIEMFCSKPIIGHGWRQVKYSYTGLTNNDAHNVYIQLLGETGLFGFLLYVSTFIFYYIKTIQLTFKEKRKKIKTINYPVMLFLLSYQTFFLLYCFSGNPLYDIQCRSLYLICCGTVMRYVIFQRYNTVHINQELSGGLI